MPVLSATGSAGRAAAPIRFVEASGSELRDRAGRRYLDLLGGWGTALLGWRPRDVVGAARRELEKLPHAPFDWDVPDRERLSAELCRLVGATADEVIPATTGTEAVEAAMRLARDATDRTRFAFAAGAYHGGGVASASLCGIDGWGSAADRSGFDNVRIDLGPSAGTAPAGAIERAGDLAGVVFEPLQANAGFRLPARETVGALVGAARRTGALVICDEVNSSLGRGGRWRGGSHFGIEPDLVVLGKGLAAGVYPVAAVLARRDVVPDTCRPGFQPSSFAWSPPGCAAALATLHAIERDALVTRARELRRRAAPLLAAIERLPCVTGVTGAGLGIGIGIAERDASAVTLRQSARRALLDRGVVVGTNPNLPGLVLMPALTIDEDRLQWALGEVGETLEAMHPA